MHASDREYGYREALRIHDLSYYSGLVIASASIEKGGYAALQSLFQQESLPDEVFAASDQIAIGAMAVTQEQSLHVLAEIALVGFDYIETAQYTYPPLTTVHQDMLGQGQLEVRKLLDRINGVELTART